MSALDANQLQLLTAARERAEQLSETLLRHESEIAASQWLKPVQREEGLAVLRRAIDAAQQLAAAMGKESAESVGSALADAERRLTKTASAKADPTNTMPL